MPQHPAPARALAASHACVQALHTRAGRHPNVVNFLALCHNPPAIVTEYCARGSLAEVLAAARADPALAAHLTWPLRLRMAADAAAGMLYLHTRPSPVVHRGGSRRQQGGPAASRQLAGGRVRLGARPAG